MDPELFALSYDYVGDLAETVALVWPAKPGANREPELSEVVDALRSASRARGAAADRGLAGRARRRRPLGAAEAADRRPARRRLGAAGQAGGWPTWAASPVAEIEEVWHGLTPPYDDLFAWLERPQRAARRRRAGPLPPGDAGPGDRRGGRLRQARSGRLRRRMEMGRHPRAGASASAAQRRLYSRTGDDISDAFPGRDRGAGLRRRDRRRAAGHARRRASRRSATCSSG